MYLELVDSEIMEVLFFGGPKDNTRITLKRELPNLRVSVMKRSGPMECDMCSPVTAPNIEILTYFFHEYVGEKDDRGMQYAYLVGTLNDCEAFDLGDSGLNPKSALFAEYIVSLCKVANLRPHAIMRPGHRGEMKFRGEYL
jgi:hypothetical protein